jgi:hypothetical protein
MSLEYVNVEGCVRKHRDADELHQDLRYLRHLTISAESVRNPSILGYHGGR